MRVRAQTAWLAVIATAFATSPALRADSRSAFEHAAEHYRAGRWAEAATEFAEVMDDPAHGDLAVRAGFYRGEALSQLGRFAEARRLFAELLEQAPDHCLAPQAMYRRGEAAYLAGERVEARAELERFCNRYADDPRSGYAHLYLARIAADEGEPQRQHEALQAAAERFDRLLERDDDQDAEVELASAEYRSALATCYARLARLWDAERILTRLQSRGPLPATAARACAELAEAAYAAGDYQRAAKWFEVVADTRGDESLACRGISGLAWCHFEQGDWQAAADSFGRAAGEHPREVEVAAEATLMRGRALERLEQYDQALAAYQQLVERHADDPRQAEAMWSAARMHDKLAQTDEAVELYRKLADLADFSHRDAAIYRLAWLEHQAGHHGAANAAWQRLRHEQPKSPLVADATLRLAEQALADRRFDEADRLCGEIDGEKTLVAVRAHALLLEARVAMAQQRFDQVELALARLDAVLADAPDADASLALAAAYWRAEASFRLGKYEEAAERLTRLADMPEGRTQSWSAAAALRHAQALAHLKRWPEVRGQAEELMRRYPGFDRAFEAQYLIGRVLLAEAELSEARAMFVAVADAPQAKATETAAMARFMIGETHFHQEDFAAALAAYRTAEQQGEFIRWRAAALLQAGKCHEALGQWTNAIADYERLARDYPASPLAQDAASRAQAARLQARTVARPAPQRAQAGATEQDETDQDETDREPENEP